MNLDEIDIDELLKNSDFGVKEKTQEEIRRESIKELTKLNTEEKDILYKKRSIMGSLADQEVREDLEKAVNFTYKDIVERDGVENFKTLDLVEYILTDKHLLQVFLDNRYRYCSGEKVFTNHSDNKFHKKLARDGVINKTDAKENKTALNIIKYVHESKSNWEITKRHERELKELKARLSCHEERLSRLESGVKTIQKDVEANKESIEYLFSILKGVSVDRIRCYVLYQEGVPVEDIQDIIGISRRTVFRWVRDVKAAIDTASDS